MLVPVVACVGYPRAKCKVYFSFLSPRCTTVQEIRKDYYLTVVFLRRCVCRVLVGMRERIFYLAKKSVCSLRALVRSASSWHTLAQGFVCHMTTCVEETGETSGASEIAAGVEAVTVEEPPSTLQSILDIEDLRDRLLFLVPPSTLCGAISQAFSAAFGQTFRCIGPCGQMRPVVLETSPRNEYWVSWLEQALAPAPPTGVLAQWRSSNGDGWYCYWSGSTDPDAIFVFSPPLEQTVCGLVRPAAWDYTALPAREVYRELIQLLALASDSSIGNGRRGIGWGDEGDGQWIPFLVPWSLDSDGDFTPEALLRKLGAHPELCMRPGPQAPDAPHVITEREVQDEDEYADDYADEYADDVEHEDPDEDEAFRIVLTSRLRAWQFNDDPWSTWGGYGDPTLVFHVGSTKLNPVPCFAVSQVAHAL